MKSGRHGIWRRAGIQAYVGSRRGARWRFVVLAMFIYIAKRRRDMLLYGGRKC